MGLYPKLAWDGIRKNRQLYLPYLLTCAGMVMMFYIILSLSVMPQVKAMSGGGTTVMALSFGTWIVLLFACIFLVYTNAFLMRRRQREFGLYHVLGMSKGNLNMVLFWETVILFALSVVLGLTGGIALSKLAELGLVRAIQGQITYRFTINWEAAKSSVLVFIPIFLLIYLKNLVQVWRMSAVSLLKSESTGEKPPKANYLLGIAGIVILAAAYYIAVSIRSPLLALSWFFIAVAMVIVATYLLFISGSVMMCRILQKHKGYYYRKQHFVSVSSMVYRMKRNGAGLASICILSTMVLVMLVGSGSLFFGAEDSLRTRYPRDLTVSVDFLSGDPDKEYSEEKAAYLMKEIRGTISEFGGEVRNEESYRNSTVVGMLQDGNLVLDHNVVNDANLNTMENVCTLCFVPLSDYNRCMGAEEILEENQVLLHCVRRTYTESVIRLNDETQWQVKNQVPEMMGSSDAAMNIIPTVFLVVPDLEPVITAVNGELESFLSGEDLCRQELYYGFDTDLSADDEVALASAIRACIREMELDHTGGFYSASVECRENERSDFYGTFGGLFFLGILLSIVFLMATVLIIYYKQVSEGYEDQGRFAIMQKVGMSKADIRRNVNSQVLTVFFLPLLTAVLHLCFAFPMVKKLLMLFNLQNMPLMLTVTAATVLAFGILYGLIYKLTANAYYTIVSGGNQE